MKYFIKIFGCQMNYSDAERISTFLEKNKAKQTASTDEADLIVFVTCGVRQSAENRVYGQINNLHKKYPEKKIILTGCLAHRKDVRRRLIGKVGLFCEIKNFPNEIHNFFQKSKFLPRRQAGKIPTSPTGRRNSSFNDNIRDYLKIEPHYESKYTVYVPVMTGCNNFCAYCVVPYARGREYSRPAEDILKEVKNLVKKGCKEIVLLGQNVNSYKSKIPDTKKKNIHFSDLLQSIDSIKGSFWITFLTSHPKDMSRELIKTIAKSKKICEYVSLPAQSGDNEILRKMKRNYSIAHYKNLIKMIRADYNKYRPKVQPSISTDIIVGFPGETKKQFENTAKLFREMKFDMAYISQYSPRPETIAWKMKDSVSKKEKERRDKALTKILAKTALENNKKYVGKTAEVLVDSTIPGLPSPPYKYSSHTRTQKKVIFLSNKKIPAGNFAKVKITKAKAFGLEGEII